MPEYLSPGVYVEEVPSSVKPIVGVSTSTAAFLGIVPNQITMVEENPNFDPSRAATDEKAENSRFFSWTYPAADDAIVKTTQDDLTQAQQRLEKARQGADANPKEFRDANNAVTRARSALARAMAHRRGGDMADAGHPVLCTTFGDFVRSFGGFSTNADQNRLAQGVYGFFNNGGTRCFVMRYPDLNGLRSPEALVPLEAIDEISIVVAPGIIDPVVQTAVSDHCTRMSDRFAILDAPHNPAELTAESIKTVHNTDYGALYFPWIKVYDEATALTHPDTDGEILVAPSGHMAGIYARVDHERGVHKAPANEVVRGALSVDVQISRAVQDGLNPQGINCIRVMNDRIVAWGARTIGGDFNADLKYINVRRLLLFLRKSIDHGTQWVVFEPNDRTLWAKIVRNVTAFLTTVWRDGALFGSTPAEAFYVRCDDETNPPEERDLGRVITEIGVAIVRPAEFVIFRIEQWAGPEGQ
jgi:phage tail sheath protein FI